MKKSGKMWKDCQSAYSAILEECKNGTAKVLANSGEYKYYELDNGLYVWDLGNKMPTIITKSNPFDSKVSLDDIYPAISIREVYELDGNRHGNYMFDFSIVHDEKNKKFSDIKCSPDTGYGGTEDYELLLDSNEPPIYPKENEEFDDVQKLIKDAEERSTEDVLKDAYKKAAELYDLFIQKSKDKEKTTVNFEGNSKDIDSDSGFDMLDRNEQNVLENHSVEELEAMLQQQLDSNKLKSEELTKLQKRILIEKIKMPQQEGKKLDSKIRDAKSQNRGE